MNKITVAGFGGQGVMMIGQMLAYAGNSQDLNTLWYPSYGPETRGGTANCAVIISPTYINSPIFSKANTLIALNKPSLQKFCLKVINDGIILYNSSLITDVNKVEGVKYYGVPANDMAMTLGNPKVINMVIMGAYLELTNVFSQAVIEETLIKLLGPDKSNLIDINIQAINAGRAYIKNLGEMNA
jgi:2-oxoglutarate ferredoxin oxidoreductase subunit gamma